MQSQKAETPGMACTRPYFEPAKFNPMPILSILKRTRIPILLLLCHCSVLIAFPDSAARALASNMTILAACIAAVWSCWHASMRGDRDQKRFWRLISAAFVFWSAGTVVWIAYESLLHRTLSSGGLTDVFYLAYGGPLMLALFVRPFPDRVTRSERWLEALQVFIVLAVTYLSLLSAAKALGSVLAVDVFAVQIYNLQNAVLCALFLLQALGNDARLSSSLRRVTWYLVAYGIGAAIWNYLSIYYKVSSGSFYDLFFSVPFLFAAALARTWKPSASVKTAIRLSPATSLLVNCSRFLVPLFPLLVLAVDDTAARQEYKVVMFGAGLSFLCYAARLVSAQHNQAALLEQLSTSEQSLKLRQIELENSEQRYRAITENTSDAIVVCDEWNEIRFCNKATEHMLGYRVQDLVGKNLMILLPARVRRSRAKVLRKYQQSISKTASSRSLELQALHANGAAVPVEVSLTEYWQDGERLFMARARTIADRKEAEEARRKSDERARVISQATNDAVWDWDLATDALWWGDGYQSLFGYSSEEMEPNLNSWTSRIHPEDSGRVVTGIKQFIKTGESLWSDEYRFRRRDGSYAHILDRGHLMRNDAGTPVRMIGAMADVSERHLLSEQLRQAQKMEAIGQLAGGVAHDMNNVLMVMNSYLTLLGEQLEPSEKVGRYLREMQKAAEKGASFTSQLLAFSRKQMLMPEALQLNDFIRDQMSILQRLIGEDIELTFAPCPNSPTVKFDRGQLAQVLMNLAANARDAMPMGGTVLVETREVELDANSVFGMSVAKPGAHVCLSVTDNGIGMSEEVRAHIFEPFFTTKGRASGTGLGLATVYGIVQQSESSIDVVSMPGQGTTFNIYIPASEDVVQRKQQEVSAFDLNGAGTILLVEDEEGIRTAAAEYLRELGYNVLTAEDGVEAMRIARERTTIDLLISDVIMPRMSGKELVSKFRALYPYAAALLISGYTDELLKNHSVVATGIGYLQKPFSLKHLAERVRDLLAKQAEKEQAGPLALVEANHSTSFVT